MAEAMIINKQLDVSPDKSKHVAQQLCYSQQPNNNHLIVQQQLTNVTQNDNNNNNFGYLPGYLYSCYPFVMSPAKSSQDLSSRNSTPLTSSQQQLLDGSAMQQPQQHQQSVLLHNGLVPSGYVSGFYSLVPLRSMVTNEMHLCQQATMPSDHNYHHPFQPVDGQGMQALLGPIIGYPLPYLPQHFQQQQQRHPQQQFKQHQQLIHLSQQFTSNCTNMMTVEGHMKVIIMKDASIQTEFNDKISEQILLDHPNSFYLGGEDGFRTAGNDSSESLSKATDTYSLLKGRPLEHGAVPRPPFAVESPNHRYGQMSDCSYRAPNECLQQLNSINPHLSSFPQHFANMSFPAPLTTLQRNVSGFCLSSANYNKQMQLAPNLIPISSNLNVFPSSTLNTTLISNKQSTRIEANGRQKFYRKTRTDRGQNVANPTFEIKKEFSDIVDAVGNLVAKSGPVGNSEPSSSRASSKSADLSQHPSEEKITHQNSGTKGYKNVKQSFASRCLNNVENGKFGKRNTFNAFGKMLGFVPAENFGRMPFEVYNGIGRRHSGVDVTGWTQAGFQKNHDVRSTKRKQQKRQMLANKAAEEEMEEISKERDNLLKEIMSTKGVTPSETEGVEGAAEERLEPVAKQLVEDNEPEVVAFKKDDREDAAIKFTDFDGDESSAILEFVEPPETCVPAQHLNSIQKPLHSNNSLEENPSPLSQMSPLTFSPPLSCPNELMDVEGSSTGIIVSKIHSRRFREYCSQVLDKEIDDRCVHLLQDLVKFQDRMYHIDPSKAKQKKRFVLGLREVAKHLKMGKLKCVIISPNLEQTQSKGGLDEALKSIIETCQAREVPFIFALGRRALGRACAKLVPVSVVGIFSYEGVEEDFDALKSLTEKARSAYTDMVNNLKKEASIQVSPADNSNLEAQVPDLPADKCDPSCIKSSSSSVVIPVNSSTPSGPPQGGFEKLFPHLGHSRTPSACSAISFVSSVLSEPISENFPQSEAEIETKNCEEEQNIDKDVTAESKDKEVESKSSHAECDGDNSPSQKLIPPLSLLNFRGMAGNEAAINKEGIGCSSTSKMSSEVLERVVSDVKHRGSLLILTSIHENCELELPVSKTHSPIGKDPLDEVRSETLSNPRIDEEDCYEKWMKSKRLSDRTRKFSCLEDSNDGNDADTEEDLKLTDGIPHTSPNIPAPRNGSCSREFSSLTQFSGVAKTCRRRSKEDKSDDDKTIILSKCDEDTMVFACENPSLERPTCSIGSSIAPASDRVEVLLARFMTSGLSQCVVESHHENATIFDLARSSEGSTDIQEHTSILDLTSKASRIESWLAASQQALKNVTTFLEEMNEEDDDDDDDKEDTFDGEFGNEDDYNSQ